jgi:3-phenylpropionate/trans-cinnamate dioxygenase ferredoxin component
VSVDDGFELVAYERDVADGEVLGVETPRGERVCLVNRGGEICAVHDVCTHAEFAMSEGTLLPDGTIECVWHGARFDPRTGAATKGPAVDPLPTYAVRVEGGAIWVGPRKESP